MKNNDRNVFQSTPASYYRFTKRELLEQKKDLILYLIEQLSTLDVASLQSTIADIKNLTGLDISLERAIQLKRFAMLTEEPVKEVNTRTR